MFHLLFSHDFVCHNYFFYVINLTFHVKIKLFFSVRIVFYTDLMMMYHIFTWCRSSLSGANDI